MSRPDRWEEFARRDPEYHITGRRANYGRDDVRAAFFESGRRDADAILRLVHPHVASTRVAVEIGCGVGRLTLPMAAHFGEIRAVDVSPTMLRLLRQNAAAEHVSNIRTFLDGEGWDEPASADLVYSAYTFQHVDERTIAHYVDRIARSLTPDGVVYLQADTRPKTLAYHVRNALPDALLPRPWRRGLRTLRRSPETFERMFSAVGLTILAEEAPTSRRHVFVLRAS